jgi:putative SOS response-associated peptidase YedK
MPMVITRAAMDAWLDPELTDPAAALDLLAVTEAEVLEAYPVSTAVNSVQNNDPSLLEPIPELVEDPSTDAQGTLI